MDIKPYIPNHIHFKSLKLNESHPEICVKDWCGHQDLIRLNVLGIEGYDAVAYFDGDCEFQASAGMFGAAWL